MMFALNFIALVVLAFLVDSNVASPNVSRRSAQACASSNVPRFNPLAVFRTPPASGSPTTPIRMIDALTIPHIGWGIFSAGGSTPVSVSLVTGESPLFVSTQFPPPAFTGYCSAADPAGGPDLLTVGGQSLWALCPNTTVGGRNDLVWSPVANHAHYSLPSCQEVDIQMIPA
ncbi:hypothetical protein AB1N83_009543 [Pleurotus pulmonarius]